MDRHWTDFQPRPKSHGSNVPAVTRLGQTQPLLVVVVGHGMFFCNSFKVSNKSYLILPYLTFS